MDISINPIKPADMKGAGRPKGIMSQAIIGFANNSNPGDALTITCDNLEDAKTKASAAYNIVYRYGLNLMVNRTGMVVTVYREEDAR